MKLGEALAERAALSRQINTLRSRIAASAVHNEDELPPEDANALMVEADETADRLSVLIAQINRTNSNTLFNDSATVTDALARRDGLSTKLGTLEAAAQAVVGKDRFGYRYGRSELKQVFAVNVETVQAEIKRLSAERRTLDAALQTLSWTTELAD